MPDYGLALIRICGINGYPKENINSGLIAWQRWNITEESGCGY
jgi:hypothetical protein